MASIPKEILEKLSKMSGYNTIKDIAKKIDVNEDKLRRFIEELKEFKVAEEKITKNTAYTLTPIGKKYIKDRFPEEILAKELKTPKTMEEIQKSLGHLAGLCIGVGKREGLIAIEKGEVKLVKNIDLKFYERVRDALKEINEGKEPKNITDAVKVPKLLEKKEVQIREIKFLSSKFKDIEMEDNGEQFLTQKMLKDKSWEHTKLKEYDVSVSAGTINAGKFQPYKRFLDLIREKLTNLGFEEMETSLITSEFYNFDVLFQPQNHPARTWTDTYSLKTPSETELPEKKIVQKIKDAHETGADTGSKGWGYKWNPQIARKLMPAAQGTAFSAKKIAQGIEVPKRYFALARVFRPDVLDATHLNEFNQLEGFVVAKDINFKHLLGLLSKFAKEVTGAKEIKFFPDYYPFTEPSVQMSAKHPKLGWVEFGGAGIFRPEFTKSLGVDEKVIAWGLGIDRLAMFNLGLHDIRDLFTSKLEWLRKKEIVEKI